MSQAGAAVGAFRESRWFKLVWIGPIVVVGLAVIVLIANIVRSSPGGQSFLETYPGEATLPEWAPVGFPAWLQWQHAINVLFLVLIIRTGWLIRTATRPKNGFYTRNNTGLIRTKYPPKRISMNLWFHLSLDIVWVANGVLFYVLIFSTGQWTRIVPTDWDVFPNAVSAGLQYASLNWPTEDGWVNYNGLQLLSYFAVVFLAAPLAILTGFRMSPSWSKRFARFDKVYPVELARKIHFPTMIFFVVFVFVHVVLVFATGALRNLNHMYAGSDEVNWWGFGIFVVSILVVVAAWIAARPLVLRSLASLTGTVSR
jgi:thiosulfate reductase cytochrome b subunit